MVGIITFQFAYNYGAVLQAYALNTYINNEIGKCKIINYRPNYMVSNYRISSRDILKNPRKLYSKIRRKNQDTLFDEFICKKLACYSKISNLSSESDKFSAIITGSDQVWNISITNNDLNYFLKFAHPNVKRISYGASIGNSKIVNNYNNDILTEINKFDYISCREESAIVALNNRLKDKRNIEPVVDPTLLLDNAEWEALSNKPNENIPEKYILYYALTEDDSLIKKAETMSKELDCPILSIHPLTKKWRIKGINLKNVGPCEFLWLIKNADYIFTNSFHGSVFSVIFRKKCVLMAHKKLGERNRQLLEWMNLENTYFGEVIDFSKCDYKEINDNILSSKKFIHKALE